MAILTMPLFPSRPLPATPLEEIFAMDLAWQVRYHALL